MQDKIIRFGAKILKQMRKRGWTEESVRRTIQNPSRTCPGRDRRHNDDTTQKNETATVYYRNEGHYVSVNDLTGDVVQIGDLNDPEWIDPFGVRVGND